MSTGLRCAVVTSHRPSPLTTEQHHLIPVAWQLTWQPAVAPFPGRDPDGRGLLWDSRTVPVCPTHHRNVHALIVLLMRQVAALGVDAVPAVPFPELPARLARAHAHELEFAQLGLQRFLDAGGSLLGLTAVGEWGES